MTFASPVSVTAGTTYVASYFAPSGHYSHTSSGLATAVDNPPLHALADSTSSNGVYAYSTTSTFPSSTYAAANYWVDVMYAVPAPGQVTGATAVEAGQHSADVSWTAPAERRPGDLVQDHPVHRLDGADGDDGHRHAAGDEQDHHRADERDDLHVHRRRRSTPTARARRRRSPTP